VRGTPGATVSHGAVHAWLLLLPALLLLIGFTHYPTVATLIDSFYSTPKGSRPGVWVGLENYQVMVEDPVFWRAVRNNLWFAGATIPLSIGLALVMALWVNERIAGRAFLRMAYFTPTVLPMIAVANLWLYFYTPQIGLLDKVAALFGAGSHNWLGNPDTVMGCLVAMTIWKEAGFFMIFYLAALQSLPPELEEAARIEGASRWYFFRRVTFPLLMPTTLFVLVNATINSFKLVDHLFILTKGGPDNASNLLLYYIYQVAFSFFDVAYAATLTVVLLVLLAVFAVVQFQLIERRVHYR
jgi:sn-glycerol 3-phosphate transport system permease protein